MWIGGWCLMAFLFSGLYEAIPDNDLYLGAEELGEDYDLEDYGEGVFICIFL